MSSLNIIFSRSYACLTASRRKTIVKNLISRNVSKTFNAFVCSPIDRFADKTSNDNLKERHLSEDVTLDDRGYSERLESEGNTTFENGESVAKAHNEVQLSSNVQLLEKNTYDLNDALDDSDMKLPGPFDRCEEDLSHIGPNITPTFNFAKFADQSRTIQELVKLGVELYKLEVDRQVLEMFLSLDFDKHMKPYIQFLHDCGVKSENLGRVITRNPLIFKEDMNDLYTRIRYLRAHKFNPEMIESIINKHPPWLSYKTKEIDMRLGHFQNIFYLNGYQIRLLTTQCPKLITYKMNNIRHSTFAVKEEMGFDKDETRVILLKAPRVWIRSKAEVVKTFDYLHNHMQLSHTSICLEPQILLCRKSRLERRHKFLVELKKDQYDTRKPLYVSPMNLVRGSDVEFCQQIAKTSIHVYNEFLKSL